MSFGTFNGREVLTTGRGQCVHCTAFVDRLLVQDADGKGRIWYVVEVGRSPRVIHECRRGPDPASLRKAA